MVRPLTSHFFEGSVAGAHASLFLNPIRLHLPPASQTDAKASYDDANSRL